MPKKIFTAAFYTALLASVGAKTESKTSDSTTVTFCEADGFTNTYKSYLVPGEPLHDRLLKITLLAEQGVMKGTVSSNFAHTAEPSAKLQEYVVILEKTLNLFGKHYAHFGLDFLSLNIDSCDFQIKILSKEAYQQQSLKGVSQTLTFYYAKSNILYISEEFFNLTGTVDLKNEDIKQRVRSQILTKTLSSIWLYNQGIDKNTPDLRAALRQDKFQKKLQNYKSLLLQEKEQKALTNKEKNTLQTFKKAAEGYVPDLEMISGTKKQAKLDDTGTLKGIFGMDMTFKVISVQPEKEQAIAYHTDNPLAMLEDAQHHNLFGKDNTDTQIDNMIDFMTRMPEPLFELLCPNTHQYISGAIEDKLFYEDEDGSSLKVHRAQIA